MDWKIKEINLSDVDEVNTRKSKYEELNEKVLQLEVGRAFEIELENTRQAVYIRQNCYYCLKKKGLLDNYLIAVRKNKVYCGRLK